MEKDEVKVTIWCLAYNHEKYIRQTLEGFVNQKTTFKYEIIVNDDASTDGTAEIIREYEKKYPELIRAFYQKKNLYSQGVVISEKILHPNAKGKYVAYCEGDDYWCDENKLQLQYEAMEQNPSVVLCTNKVRVIDEMQKEADYYFPINKEVFCKSMQIDRAQWAEILFLKEDYPFQTSSYFIKRAILETNERKKLQEVFVGDRVKLYLPLLFGDVIYIDRVMSCYRKNVQGSWSMKLRQKDEYQIFRHICENVNGKILLDEMTNGVYRELIGESNCMSLMAFLGKVDEATILDELKKLPEGMLPNQKFSKRARIKYHLFRTFPRFTVKLIEIKNKKRNSN